MTLFDMDGHPISPDGEGIVERTLNDARVMFVSGFSSLTMYYEGRGNALLDIESSFAREPPGVVLLETSKGGREWHHLDCTKVGRGMMANATATGPAHFRTQLDSDHLHSSAIRVRCQDTPQMLAITVSMTFAGATYRHIIRPEPDYVIQEEP